MILAQFLDRVRRGCVHREQARPETDGPRILTLVRRDPKPKVSLVLDATANVAMFAIVAHADEREADVREVERSGQNLPEGSYGRSGQAIAARLRTVQQAYRTAIDRDTVYTPPEPTRTGHSPKLQTGRDIDLEPEP